MTNIEVRTQNIYENLSNAEKKVASYFLDNVENVFAKPISQLAEESGVSKVAWVRFCKAIGFDGLKDLKKSLFSELHETAGEPAEAAAFSDIREATGIDQLIKLWAVQVLQPVGAMPLIPHVVELRFVLNQGMAFSLLSGKQLFLIIATSAALLAVAYGLFFRSRGKRLQQAALVLVLGGGIGNLIDRVLNGEVVDYINLLFMRFAVFNFADICVCVGVALWVLVIFLDEVHADDAASKEQ